MTRRRPVAINARPVADHFSSPGERIIEFSSPNGGGLISFRLTDDGVSVEIHSIDETVTVVSPKKGNDQ